MIEMIITYGVFFGIPILSFILFIISLALYISAKIKNKRTPDTIPLETVIARRSFLIVCSVIAAIMLAIIIGLVSLVYSIVAYM